MERAGRADPAIVVATEPPAPLNPTGFVAPQLHDVADEVGLRFRHGAFRFSLQLGGRAGDDGRGLCWLDYDADGWLDLFMVNLRRADVALEGGGRPPRSALPQRGGTFTDVSRGSGPTSSCATDAWRPTSTWTATRTCTSSTTYDALLWNRGDGTFSEIKRPAGIAEYGWHAARPWAT